MNVSTLDKPRTIEEEMYQENIIDHYKNPHNKGKLEGVQGHREYNPLCGDDIALYLKIEEDRIVDVSFEGNGCAISQASISMLTDYIKGKSVEDVKKITPEDVLGLLGIPISHTRMKCAMLSLKALEGSLK